MRLTLYRVLHARRDARAAPMLARAHEDLQARAARITDARMREGFLHAVPHHREIVEAWQRGPAAIPQA